MLCTPRARLFVYLLLLLHAEPARDKDTLFFASRFDQRVWFREPVQRSSIPRTRSSMRGCGEQVNGDGDNSGSRTTAAAATDDDYGDHDDLAEIEGNYSDDVSGDDMEACFKVFDKDQDGYLNQAEFDLLCKALFRNEQGKVYPLDEDELKDVFEVFDTDANGLIDKKEFEMCWYKWIKACTRPKCALLVVDVQNDFITGSLNIRKCAARHDGHEVIAPINKLLEQVAFDSVFYSLDWHPANHVSFIDNLHLRELDESCKARKDEVMVYDTVTFKGPPQVKQRLWPRHCVQDTWGAEIHADLKIVDRAVKVYKGTNPEVDSYSVFWDNNKLSETTLSAQLRERGITDIFVCGVAYDVCVGATAVDALVAGYRTVMIDDCCRGVDLDDIERTKSMVCHMHGVIAHSDQVKNMVQGKDRRAELGYKLAMEIKKKRLKKIEEREKTKTESEAQH